MALQEINDLQPLEVDDDLTPVSDDTNKNSSLYEAAKETGRVGADILNNAANMPSALIDLAQSGMSGLIASASDIAGGNNTKLGKWLDEQSKYTPVAPHADLTGGTVDKPHTLVGQIASGIGSTLLIPDLGAEKATMAGGKLISSALKKGEGSLMSRIGQQQMNLLGANVLPSAQAAAQAQREGDSGLGEFAQQMALGQSLGTGLHAVGKGIGKTVRGVKNIAGKSSPAVQAVSDKALENPDVQNFLDTATSMGIEVSPRLQKGSVVTANGVIPVKDLMKFKTGVGEFDELAKASNRTHTIGMDSADDVEREANRLANIEAQGNRYLNAKAANFNNGAANLNDYVSNYKPRGEENADVRRALQNVKNLYARLQKASTSSKEINHNISPEAVRGLDVAADSLRKEFQNLPDIMQEDLRRLGVSPEQAAGDTRDVIDAYQVLHAEHPNFQRSTTESGTGEGAGGGHSIPIPGLETVGKIEKLVSAVNPYNRLVSKPAARRAVVSTNKDVQALARLAAKAGKPQKETGLFSGLMNLDEDLTPFEEAQEAPTTRASELSRSPRQPKAEEPEIEQVVEQVAEEVKGEPVPPKRPRQPKAEEPKRETLGKGFSAMETARIREAETKAADAARKQESEIAKIKATISNPEYAEQITPENYQDTNFVNRMRNLSGRRGREDIIAQMKNAAREKQIREEAKSPANVDALDKWAKEQEAAKTGINQGHVDQAVRELYGKGPVSSVSKVQTRARALAKAEKKATDKATEAAQRPSLDQQYEEAQAFAKRFAPNTPEIANKLIEQKFASRRATGGEAIPNKELENLYNSIHSNENAHVRAQDAVLAASEQKKYDEWFQGKADEEKAAREAEANKSREAQEAAQKLNEQKMLGSQVGNIRSVLEGKLKGVEGSDNFIDEYMDKRFSGMEKPMSDTQRLSQISQAENAADKFKREGGEKAESPELPESVQGMTPDEVKELTTDLHDVLRQEMDRGVSGDTETMLNSIEALASRLEGEDATKLRNYARSMKTALAHKAQYPNNPELWLTNADKNGLQGDTNSYAGKLWKQMVSQITGSSRTEAYNPLDKAERDRMAIMADSLDKDLSPNERAARMKKLNDVRQEVFGSSMAIGKAAKEEGKALAQKAKEAKEGMKAKLRKIEKKVAKRLD